MGQSTQTNGQYRKLWPADLPLFRDHLLRLDDEGRRSRFAMAASDEFVRDYAETGFAIGAVLIGYFEDGFLRAVAELRPVGSYVGDEMEAAFSVEADWRRRGIATGLFRQLLDSARNRNVRWLYTNCLRTNQAMQGLARKFEGELNFEGGDAMAIVPAPHWTPLSLWREAFGDAAGLSAAMANLQRRMLRTT